jgi:hypothetical protein
MKKLLLDLGTAMLAVTAKANQKTLPNLANMKVNVRYLLTEKRARSLNIDLALLKAAMAVKETEQVAVLLDENAQLNLSIFDEEAFNQIAMDIIK